MLKAHCDLLPGLPHIPLLYPNLGRPENEGRMGFLNEAFDDLKDPFVEIVQDPTQADIILCPHNFPQIKMKGTYLQKLSDLSQDLNKKVIVFWHGDDTDEVDIPNSIIFRTSQYRHLKLDNEIIMPPYTPDLMKGRELVIRHKAKTPVVGFCGWARYKNHKNRFGTLAKNLLIDFKRLALIRSHLAVHKKGLTFRQKACRALKDTPLIEANFILRKSYSGSPHTIKIAPKEGREEYIQNIIDSDFPLAVKGDGNYSYRFYEALSLGRPPVFIDTDCVLPLEDKINYDEFIIRVSYKDASKIDSIVSSFYEKLDEETFVSMQKKAREAFENYLSVGSFLRTATERLI
ncbi:MAG: exostosin family protein [Candidatus Peribacteraceae bacterium]|jgi:hypothetical protein|nr:exostosin family protein [Candidatus Peribacteraceae bacterium]MDP7454694.1 exostosin family protein [Candidatus Peribacteraceae bacterium]MDP7646295.1 exostosin family protein [Candidatus Peribacteraceae bacterium]|tara:strand:+ start:4110 stop:5147 length:1038 start_codon:yes stop_codon:yes gene_type:complete